MLLRGFRAYGTVATSAVRSGSATYEGAVLRPDGERPCSTPTIADRVLGGSLVTEPVVATVARPCHGCAADEEGRTAAAYAPARAVGCAGPSPALSVRHGRARYGRF